MRHGKEMLFFETYRFRYVALLVITQGRTLPE